MILRLSPTDRAALGAQAGAKPFEPMPGRPMREYVTVPPALRERPGELAHWVAQAVAFAGSLPPKAGRPGPRKRAQQRGPR
jgi:hypothetical protein